MRSEVGTACAFLAGLGTIATSETLPSLTCRIVLPPASATYCVPSAATATLYGFELTSVLSGLDLNSIVSRRGPKAAAAPENFRTRPSIARAFLGRCLRTLGGAD